MSIRGPLACGVWLLSSVVCFAQTEDRATSLPPLLTVPDPMQPPPLPPVTQPPVVVYDPGYQYIPEHAPEQTRLSSIREPYSRWWTKTSLELAWTSSSPAPNTLRLRPPDLAGRTVPGLHIPLGGSTYDPFRVGLGLNVGRWFGDDTFHAIEGSFFILPEISRTFDGFAPGSIVMFPDGANRSAPVFLRLPNTPDSVGTTLPSTVTSWFAGADVNYRVGLLIGQSARLDLLAGYRFAYLQDNLYLGEFPEANHDEFSANKISTTNAFHGGQLGLSADYHSDLWYAEGSVKVAYGGVFSRTSASGAFLYSRPAVHITNTTTDAVLPTLNLRLGYRIGARGHLFAGYTFQYISDVHRLGNAFTGECLCNDFWVQSLGLGFEWHF